MKSNPQKFKFLPHILVVTATVVALAGVSMQFVRANAGSTDVQNLSEFFEAENSVKLMPSAPKQSNRGNSGQSLNNFGNFEEFMRAAPFYLRGNDLLKKKDYQGAIEQYNTAISNYSEHAEAYAQRGVARNQIGDRSGAIEDLQQAAMFFEAQGQPAAAEKVQEILDGLQ
jgi:tetratricopeptide (TPR) repeat protein